MKAPHLSTTHISENGKLDLQQSQPRSSFSFRFGVGALLAYCAAVLAAPASAIAAQAGSDLFFAEVEGWKPTAYTGETLNVKLRLWIKPFFDSELEVSFSPQQMWQRLSIDESDWGVFEDAVTNLPANFGSTGTKARSDRGQLYYVYDINASIAADDAAQLDPQELRIVVSYPTRLTLAAGLLGIGSYGVANSREVAAGLGLSPVSLKPIPTHDRPADFRGAVGQFAIETTAAPHEVPLGEPITLHINLQSDQRLDKVEPPPLADHETLTNAFRLSDDRPAGILEDDVKRFSVSLRPRSIDVDSIPPIPFSYFDPDSEEFVTVQSSAIPLRVLPAAAPPPAVATRPVPPSVAKTRSSAQAPPADESTSPTNTWLWLAIILATAAGGIALIAIVATRRSSRGSSTIHAADPAAVARKKLADAADPSDVAEAVLRYIAARFDLTSQSLTPQEALVELQNRGIADDDLIDLLRACDQIRYAHSRSHDLTKLRTTAEQCITRLDRSLLDDSPESAPPQPD